MGDTCTIGIDLGTSNSCVATYSPSGHEIIRNKLGGRTTPSVVSVDKAGVIIVGDAANRQAVMNPERTIFGVKRLVGRKYASAEVASLRQTLPYPVVEAPNRDAWVRLLDQSMSPTEVQSYILEELRAAAEDFHDRDVNSAIVTVPAFFDEAQRQATRDAGTIAGFGTVRVLAEPTAAALAYGMGSGSEKLIAVFDMGGGTLDVSVMRVQEGRYDVLATAGDMLLGGADFDRALAAALAAEIERDHGVSVMDNKVALQRLVTEAEGAKKALTELSSVTISLPYLAKGPSGHVDFERRVTREELDALVAPLIERMLLPCKQALGDAQVPIERIDEVLLIGGMTRALVVQDAVARYFDRKPSQRINPDEAVAIGASLLAGMTDGRIPGTELIDVAPHTIGMRVAGDRISPLIKRSAKLPAVAKKAFATTEDNQQTVEIQLYQGDQPVASKNTRLSTISLSGIEPAPRGKVRVGVEFHASEDGKMAIRARQLGAGGTPIDVDIVARTGLGRVVVERLASERAAARGPRQAKNRPQSAAAAQSGFAIQFAAPKEPKPASGSARGPSSPQTSAAGSGREGSVAAKKGSRAPTGDPSSADTSAAARAAVLGVDVASSAPVPSSAPAAEAGLAEAAIAPDPAPRVLPTSGRSVSPPASAPDDRGGRAEEKAQPPRAPPGAAPTSDTVAGAPARGSKRRLAPWIAVAALVAVVAAAAIAMTLV